MKSIRLIDIGRGEDSLEIPDIQRGLVWDARRIELLWDSLLRGFPIGVFTIHQNSEGRSDLIDGQQRRNAIVSAFDFNIEEVKPKQIVWIDLDATEKGGRKYCIRVTNRAHPWGYHLDGTPLSTEERRTAIEKAGYNYLAFNKSDCSLLKFFPYGANCPVPLALLLNTSGDASSRIEQLKKKVELLPQEAPIWLKWRDAFFSKMETSRELKDGRLFEDIIKLEDYEIGALDVPEDADIEVLFERIGKGGVEISNKELSYAAIKHYWGGDISRVNRELLKYGDMQILPEVDFAMLVFRLYLSGDENIRDSFSVEEIRRIHDTKEELKNRIKRAYENNAAEITEIVKRVDEWILGQEVSKYHQIVRSEIARNHDKLYILLLWIALKVKEGVIGIQNKDRFDEFMRNVAFYLFVLTSKGGPRSLDKYEKWSIQYLYRNLNVLIKKESSITEEVFINEIRRCLTDLMAAGWSIIPKDTLEDFDALTDSVSNNRGLSKYARKPYFTLFERLFPYHGNNKGLFVLKLFQNDYYKKFFSDYDPSQSELWKDTNRPWDHDHIIPRSWGNNPGEYAGYVNFFINSIGNIADIPYELNRSKGDRPEWEHYLNPENLDRLFDPSSKEAFSRISKDEDCMSELTQSKEKAELFGDFATKRFNAITKPFLSSITKQILLGGLPQILEKRKNIFLSLRQHELFRDFKLFYLSSDAGYEEEFLQDNDYAWMQTWISLGKRCEESDYMYSVTIGMGVDIVKCKPVYYAEYGIRKWAGIALPDSANGSWWKDGCYNKYSNLTEDSKVQSVCEEIESLVKEKYMNKD